MSEALAHRTEPWPVAAKAPELTLVIPTLNERENIAPLLERLELALAGTRWEVIFVDDDFRDGTPEEVREIGRIDPRVRCLQRIGRRGLSTACIEGILASTSPYVAVMDADLAARRSPPAGDARDPARGALRPRRRFAAMCRAAASAIGTARGPTSAVSPPSSRA